jgi:alkylhydroperoxidase family enzyme
MASIKTISPRQARGDLRRVYQEIRRDLVGWLPVPLSVTACNIMRIFSLRPAFLRAFEHCFLLTMWSGGLRRQAREAIGVTVAQTNGCHY